jgi:hypothetical protein
MLFVLTFSFQIAHMTIDTGSCLSCLHELEISCQVGPTRREGKQTSIYASKPCLALLVLLKRTAFITKVSAYYGW